MPGIFAGATELPDLGDIFGGVTIQNVYVGPTLIWPPTGGFTPLDFPGLTGWWTAQDLTGQADGTDVTNWGEKSGTNFDWIQDAAFDLPTKETRNTFPAVQFVRANSQIMVNDTAILGDLLGSSADGLSVAVCELATSPPAASVFYESMSVFGDGWWQLGARDVSGDKWEGAIFFDSAFFALIDATIQERAIIMMRKTGGNNVFFSLNGGTEETFTTDINNTASTPQIGGYLTTAYFDGWIYELVTSDVNGTAQERTDLIDYLKSEWGIT